MEKVVDLNSLQPPSVEYLKDLINIDENQYKTNLNILKKKGQFDFELDKHLNEYLKEKVDTRLMER